MATLEGTQLQNMIAATVQSTMQAILQAQSTQTAAVHPTDAPEDSRRLLPEKSFSRVSKFNGGESEFADFAFQFRLATKAANGKAYELLEKCVGVKDEITFASLESTDPQYRKLSIELYDLIGLSVMGEAMTIVRGVPEMNGAEAWRRLLRRYQPRSPARTLVKLMDVINPGRAKDVHELAGKLEQWQLKVGLFEKDTKEEVSPKIKAAVLLSMCMQELQDIIIQRTDNVEEVSKVKEVIMNFIDNRRSSVSPTPMDIGVCGENWGWEDGCEDINAVNPSSVCHRCGGMGHFARDCATPAKSRGKGHDVGKGKGSSKGSYGKGGMKGENNKGMGFKGSGKGKSFGKGFAGYCWNCGEQGHRADQCKKAWAIEEEVAAEVGQVEEIGGVWHIGSVDIEKASIRLDDNCALEEGDGKLQWTIVNKKSKKKTADMLPIDAVQEKNDSDFITVDSGAAESVWPENYKQDIPLLPADAVKARSKYVAANGEIMTNKGKKLVHFRTGDAKDVKAMEFQVTQVKKPLASVKKIVEKGNVVVFARDGSYIQGPDGRKTPLVEHNGTYALDIKYAVEGFTRPAV